MLVSFNNCEAVIRFAQCVSYMAEFYFHLFYISPPFYMKRCNYREYYACRLFTRPRALTTQYGTPIARESAINYFTYIYSKLLGVYVHDARSFLRSKTKSRSLNVDGLNPLVTFNSYYL